MSNILRIFNICKIREFIAWIVRNILSCPYIYSIALCIFSTRVPKGTRKCQTSIVQSSTQIHGRTPVYALAHRPADSLQSFRHTWLSALSVAPLYALSKQWTFKAGSSAGTAERMETKPYFYSPGFRISQGQSNPYCNLQQPGCPRSYSGSWEAPEPKVVLHFSQKSLYARARKWTILSFPFAFSAGVSQSSCNRIDDCPVNIVISLSFIIARE